MFCIINCSLLQVFVVTGMFDEGLMKNVDLMAAGPVSFCVGKPIIPQCVRIPNNHP